ncbi:MAG TPA: cytochrome P450, partial [Solirubrobacteraceae bacterium]|nr:cytochrome P450 [Solirubrobacteraceae bacterium]
MPPGPREPAAVQTLEWIARPTAFLRRCAARHGEAFTLRLAFDEGPLVLVWSPQAVRAVHGASPGVARRGESPGALRDVAGPRSILFTDGEEHLRVRRMMLPAFHGDRLRATGPVVSEVAAEAAASWPRGRPFAALPAAQRLTLEVILRAVLGARDPVLAQDVRRALDLTSSLPRLAALALVRRDAGPLRPWRAFRAALAAVDARLLAHIARRRAEGGGGDDVLGLLLEAGVDDQEARDHLVTLLAAGHETTAGTLAWALERLARAPAWQERAAAGEDAVLDAIVAETLRIRPVLTVAPRRLAAPLDIGEGVLPAGAHVAPCIYLLHRRADLYPDPLAWRPERFLERPPDSSVWIPFGGGTRRCLGAAFAQ